MMGLEEQSIRTINVGDTIYKKHQRAIRARYLAWQFNGDVSEGKVIKVGRVFAQVEFENKNYGGRRIEKIPLEDLLTYKTEVQYFYDLKEFKEVEKKAIRDLEMRKLVNSLHSASLTDEDAEIIKTIVKKNKKEIKW